MSGRPRGATRSPDKLRVIVNLYRGGSNYGPQAVGTALDFIARAARRVNPRIYDAYVYHQWSSQASAYGRPEVRQNDFRTVQYKIIVGPYYNVFTRRSTLKTELGIEK